MQGRNRYVITILARHITARQIASVTHVITTQGLNIDAIQRLTGRMPLADIDDTDSKSKGCVEFSVRGTPSDYAKMQSDFMNLANELEFDISLQQDNMFRRCRRLICFDMDSTLIETEVIMRLLMNLPSVPVSVKKLGLLQRGLCVEKLISRKVSKNE